MSPSSKPFVEVIVSHVKPGINLQTVVPGSHEAQVLSDMTSLLLAQSGHINLYFGTQTEKPNLFINCACWESAELSHAFMAKPESGQFFGLCSQLLDVETAPPIMFITNYNEVTKAALESSVTEISFLNLKDETAESKKQVLSALTEIDKTHRGAEEAQRAVSDWVYEVRPPTAPAAPKTGEAILCSIRGHDSTEARKSAMLKQGYEELRRKGYVLTPHTDVPGVDAETGSFHVQLQTLA